MIGKIPIKTPCLPSWPLRGAALADYNASAQAGQVAETSACKMLATLASNVHNCCGAHKETHITTGLHDMWKIRSEIKHDKRSPSQWTADDVTRIMTEVEKHTGRNERHTPQEIGAWRKRKIHKWATARTQVTRDTNVAQVK